uniref:UV radiation resistance-associated gene protein n=1 Tax=Timema genevievae TaxID=629358 RepID=A0A7R9JND1_TIMGE|nr:unnamed protein product [Timema genevievae]
MMQHQTSDMMIQPHGTMRWREWLPLATQQLRLRNLIQVIGYNVWWGETLETDKKQYQDLNRSDSSAHTNQRLKKPRTSTLKTWFYYTLHLTTMSAPFYTSEKLESDNPKWAEIDVGDLVSVVNAAANGIVVRLWCHREGVSEQALTVWGVYFSGLTYLGPNLCVDPTQFHRNTVVFHMYGGYFTAHQCIKETPNKERKTKVTLNASDVHPSYNVNLLLRLHTIQQAIKKQTLAAENLRNKISVGGFTNHESQESAVLRRLLNKSRPKAPQREVMLKVKREVELVRFRVHMLAAERARKNKELLDLEKTKHLLVEANQDRSSELMDQYQNLNKEMKHFKEWKKIYIDTRESLLHSNAQLTYRRKQLIAELSLIYPILQVTNSMYTVCGVHLPNSEDFIPNEEVMISVALGFPLFSRGKDKLQFNYGVYLLNKNIAQLRWYCGVPTQDLRATLPNLATLLSVKPGPSLLELGQQTLSGSSLDLRSSSQNPSPVGSLQSDGLRKKPIGVVTPSKSQRASKSLGHSDLQVQVKFSDPEVHSPKDLKSTIRNGLLTSNVPVNTFSYSLDKGLDEYEELQRAESIATSQPKGACIQQQMAGAMSLVGSEPILTGDKLRHTSTAEREAASSGDEGQKHYLRSWQAGGPAPICSDEDLVLSHSAYKPKDETNDINCVSKPILSSTTISHQGDPEQAPNHSLSTDITESTSQNVIYSSNGHQDDNEFFSLVTKGLSELMQDQNADSESSSCDSSDYADMKVSKCDAGKGSDAGRGSVETAVLKKSSTQNVESLDSCEELQAYSSMEEVDSLFANVASRTDALVSRTTSFNLVRSRHGSTMEDGLS